MDKKRRARRKTNADYYLRPIKEALGKRPPPSDEAVAKALAKLDGEVAKWTAGAAELPKLRAEVQRLERELWKRHLAVAALAARIHPELCETNPDEAVKLAIKVLQATKKALGEDSKKDGEKKARTRADILNEVAGLSLKYDHWVRFVTKKKKWSLALTRLKEFLRWEARRRGEKDIETWVEAWMDAYRNKARPGDWLLKLRHNIGQWWKQEKSKRAKKGGKASASQRKAEAAKRICPECGKRELEPKKRLCRYCRIRAKVPGVGYSSDPTVITALLKAEQTHSGKTPKRKSE